MELVSFKILVNNLLVDYVVKTNVLYVSIVLFSIIAQMNACYVQKIVINVLWTKNV